MNLLVVTCSVWREKSTWWCWLDKKLIFLVKVTRKAVRYGRMGLKASISQLPTFHNPQKKKKSNHLHSSTPSLLFRPFTSFSLSLSLSLYPLALATTATTSNQTKSFTFPSLALIRSAPRLHSFKLFTSLSLFLSSLYPLATTTSRLFQSSNQTKIFTFPCL